MSIEIESITVWLNAFLPREIAGQTITLREGLHAGKTAVIGPAYEITDQRAFSRDRHASARMHSCVTVDFTGATPVITQAHRCDPTIVCAPEGDAPPQHANAGTSRMKGVVSSLEPEVVIHLDAVASHPFPTLSSVAGDIAYRGDIVVDRDRRTVRVDLMIQLFPAFEGYTAINDGPAAILFHHAPPPGVLDLGLPPEPQRRIRSALHDGDGDGVFDGPVPMRRADVISTRPGAARSPGSG